MTVDLAGNASTFPPFVRCLQSLPNLHTLEIGRVDYFDTIVLENALKDVKLPQIKTLVLPSPPIPSSNTVVTWRMLYVRLGMGPRPLTRSLDLLRLPRTQKSNAWRSPWLCGPIRPVSDPALYGTTA